MSGVRRANRQDVAERAGVSTAVVSYVVNGGPRPVAPATRDRVLAAMAELHYRPNASARALSLAKTNVLGLLMTDITNPYFSEFAAHFQGMANAAGYSLMIANTGQDGARELAEVDAVLSHEVDGIVAYGVQHPETLNRLAESGVRLVSMDWHLTHEQVPTVAVDDYTGAQEAIKHLQGHGHANVGFIAGFNDPTMRTQAWEDAMQPVLGDRLDTFVEAGAFTRQGGFDAALRLLGRPDPPSALFVATDVQAFGVLAAAERLGLSVPGDLAVVSFDGTTASAFTSPPLTAIQLPMAQIAEHCLRKLVAPSDSFELHTTVPHKLEIRRSCGCR